MLYYKDFTMKRLFTALIALVAVSTLLPAAARKARCSSRKTASPRPRKPN